MGSTLGLGEKGLVRARFLIIVGAGLDKGIIKGGLSADRADRIWAYSEGVRVIKAIEDAHEKWESERLDAATQHCLQPVSSCPGIAL